MIPGCGKNNKIKICKMNYIIRDESIMTGKNNLEQLYTFKDFPVFFGCVDHSPENDLKADMSWAICPESGVIQLDKLIPLDILYQEQHVDGTGPTWQQYYADFARYIKENSPRNTLEIGGGAGVLAEKFIESTNDTKWTIVEPNPLYRETEKIKVVPSFFDENFKFDGKFDAVVFSQVMEHAYDPNKFLGSISGFLENGERLIFAYPNLKVWLENKFTNAINFEHTFFLTDYFVDCLLKRHGFKINDKTFYRNHSIFYVAEKAEIPENDIGFENKYEEYKKIFNDFIEYHKNLVYNLNKKIEEFDGEVYMFGAHIFAQFLFEFGLNSSKIISLLDNSKLKQGKRLYGSSLYVNNPEIIRDKNKVAVILKVGIYRDEILKQLQQINPNIVVLE